MKKIISSILLLSTMLCTGCVNQSVPSATVESDIDIIKATINSDSRIVATSVSLLTICSKLGVDLVAAPSSQSYEIPEEYKELPIVGNSMAVDIEILSTVDADLVISPKSLEADLKPQYEALGVTYLFLDLTSVEALYMAIDTLADIFDKNEIAVELSKDYQELLASVDESTNKPTALVLMGLPGSYVVATSKSYVGSLVELAGFDNVYTDDKDAFLNINPEDMLSKEPDYIFTTAHAMPEMVYEMFDEEFKENLIWQHFEAVKSGNVHQLQHEYFGMSANFDYQKAVEILHEILNKS